MKQKNALAIMKTGRNVFLTGSAGTGKTYIINQYIEYLQDRKIKPSIVAPTGIAASHIGGQTIHSFFGIGIKEKLSEQDLDFLLQRKYLHDRFVKLKVLIIDEISMVSPELFETMDKILRAFKFSSAPFGGVQVIISGDFFQLPPVSKEWKEKRFVWQTELWNKLDLKIAYLEEKYRQDDEKLISILDEIRSGDISQRTWELLEENMKNKVEEKNKIIPTRLYTHNIDVDKINDEELSKIDENSVYFEAVEKGRAKDIQRIYKTSLVKEKIELKKSAIVIFIKNNYEKGYINGSIGVVVDFNGFQEPIVELASGRKIVVEKEEWSIEDENGRVKAMVKQIPLRLAWAITIHKSQGMTLDMAEIDLSKTFEVGQGYVALSRLKSYEGLFLKGMNNMALQVDNDVLNNDLKFKKKSELIEKKFLSFTKNEVEAMEKDFILKIGGTLDKEEIKKEQKKKKEKKEKEEKIIVSTAQTTKDLLLKKMNIDEIAKERGLTKETILKHLNILWKNNEISEKELNFINNDKETLEAVEEAVDEILNENNEDNFLPDGSLKLKPIFDMLDGEIDYFDIRKSILILDVLKNKFKKTEK